MRTTKEAERLAGGMDERYIAEAGSASLIVNMRINREGLAWVRDRGWEPYNPTAGFSQIVTLDFSPIYSLAVWTRSAGAEVYCLYEQGGSLLYEHGLSAGTSANYPAKQYLQAGRLVPPSTDPGTQFVPHGDDLIILGSESLLRFRGDKLLAPFGYSSAPAPALVFPPDPTYFGAGAPRNEAGTVAAQLIAPRGLGDPEAASDGTELNRYLYRYAWESETGSISPMSPASVAAWSFSAAAEQGRYGVLLRELQRGPAGTVARLVYRTKNLKALDTVGGATFFLVARIPENASTDFLDITPDSSLVAEAPALTDSVTIPSTLRYGASWDGRVWLGGGPGYERRLLYSGQSAPEQFGALAYFELGNPDAGDITAIHPHYDSLLVFRERGIDAIIPDASGLLYRSSTVSADAGTTATNTIVDVPGVGVMFLTVDGPRIIQGSPDSLTVSAPNRRVARESERINESALPRASASWSPSEREWWCHYCAEGSPTPNRGIVYHVDAGLWSVRAPVSSPSSPGAFLFNAIATLPSGRFLLAPQTQRIATSPTVSTVYNRGLQVWSANGFQGERFTATSVDESIWAVSAVVDNVAVSGRWCSVWDDYGDDSIYKSVRYVLVDVVTVGNAPILLEYAVDYVESYISAGNQAPARSDRYLGAGQPAVYGLGATGDNVATIGSDVYSGEAVTRIRWDVGASASLWFKWRLTSASRFHVIRYQVGFVPRSRGVIHQGGV